MNSNSSPLSSLPPKKRDYRPDEYLQTLRDGSPDPLGRTSASGFAIAVSDGRGGIKAWGDQLFSTREAATATAAACCLNPCEIRPARDTTYMVGKNPYQSCRSKIVILRSATIEGTNA